MDILYEDGRILVCIKPAGVLSAGDEPGGMVDLLRKELGDEHACVRSVHRLDAQVSGLMVFARSQAAAGILSEQVREHVFEKEYLAVVHGRFEGASGQMEDLLWYNRSLRKSRVMDAPGKDVKRALLSYEVLGYAEHADASLVKIRLHTGRTHQIRVHAKYMGHPVVGDPLYGIRRQKFSLAGQLLHAYKLIFTHPSTGERMEFTAPLPDYFQSLLEKLGRQYGVEL